MADAFTARVSAKLGEIEAELHVCGFWQAQPPTPEQLQFERAFAADTMTFAQWLQWIFVPRVRAAIATGEFPRSSSVGAQAVREFDTEPRGAHLATLLAEFDALFEDRREDRRAGR